MSLNISRRTAIIGQACALVGIGAGVSQSRANAADLPYDLQSPPTWDTVTHVEMPAFYRDRVWAMSDDGQSMSLRLVGSEVINSGAARPQHLGRREGVVALFVSPQMDWFVQHGAQNITLGHKVLGYAKLYITPVPRRRGGHVLELVLN